MVYVVGMLSKISILWNSRIRKSASDILFATLASKITGYVREVILAALFGTSGSVDAWLVASVIPNVIFGALYGAIDNLVIPLYLESRRKGDATGNQFIEDLFGLVTAISVPVTVLLFVFSPQVVHLAAPGFHGGEFKLTVNLTRIMLPTLVLWLWSGTGSAVLQAVGLFRAPAWVPVALNIVRITSLFVLVPVMGMEGVAWGFTLGVLVQTVIVIFYLNRYGVLLRFHFTLNNPQLRKFISMSVPTIITSVASSGAIVVDRLLGSLLPSGSIAALNYSLLIIQIPLGVIVSALLTPIYTRLTQCFTERDLVIWYRVFKKSAWLFFFSMLAAALVICCARESIVSLLFGRGNFDHTSVVLTAKVLPYFLLGLPFLSVTNLFVKACLSRQAVKVVTWSSVFGVVITVISDLLLVRPLGLDGLALGTSIGIVITAASLWAYTFTTWKLKIPQDVS